MNDQVQANGKQLAEVAESAVTQAREQAEHVRASLAASDKLSQARQRATKAARKAQKVAAKRGAELSAEAGTRGKAAAKKGEQALERAIDVTRERGSDALLSALATEPGKRLAGTPAGTALKSKLTARRRRRKKLLLLVAANAGGVIAFKQLRSRRAAEASDTLSAAPAPIDTAAAKPAETPPLT